MVSRDDTEMAKKCTETEAGSNPCRGGFPWVEGLSVALAVALCSRGSMNGCCNSRSRQTDKCAGNLTFDVVAPPHSACPPPAVLFSLGQGQETIPHGPGAIKRISRARRDESEKERDQKNKKNKTGRPAALGGGRRGS